MTGGMDTLTELPGREEFDALVLREEMRRSRTGETLAVAVLDIDGLGQIVERHGSDAGGALILLCLEALRNTLRAVDEIAHTGHDEFSILLHATDAKQANAWADRFDSMLEQVATGHPAAEITCSLGVADTAETPTLVEAAQRARRRMEVVQTVRKLRRLRESGGSPPGA
jgi:diguanylate cyclase (GGDEF)-like protein